MGKFNHFNFLGPIYDFIFGRKQDKTIVDLSLTHKSQHVLDLGGGTGRVSELFKPLVKNVFIADSAQNMLLKAQKKGILVVNSQSEQLPFVNKSFERIIMVDALHHVSDQKQTIQEMWRVLAPGGKIIIEEPDIRNWFVKLVALGEKLLLMRSHFLRPEVILKMFRFEDTSSVQLLKERGIAWVIISKDLHISTREE